ncbi:glutathione binding-like protein [Brevundimonas sp.]|uniref:glutathione binding-like protein n=1 Tax=Brevundimonas sp. TaxID=1871086 RepID=UPI00289C8EDC|nr:glutathione binding-like protein [Brevundimonas sp.]
MMIELHGCDTPNGHKVAILLAELELAGVGLEHSTTKYNLLEGRHLEADFAQINPNRRLPAIVDHAPAGGGEPVAVFESGAILLYLAEKTGRFLPTDTRKRAQALSWLFWQMASLGPQHGQAHHFLRYAPEPPQYAVNRYTKEAYRLFDVLEGRLSQVDYLAGEYSIADMAVWPWVRASRAIDMDVSQWPALKRWFDRVGAREAVKRYGEVPKDHPAQARHMKLSPEQWSVLFGEKMWDAAKG